MAKSFLYLFKEQISDKVGTFRRALEEMAPGNDENARHS
jgi:hypothetical protein